MKTKLEAMKDLSGVKNKKIVLKQPEYAPDGRGGQKLIGMPDVATVWAEFRKPRSSVVSQAGTVVGELIREIKIWNRPDVRRGWQVKHGDKTYTIENTYNFDAENIILVCREVVR